MRKPVVSSRTRSVEETFDASGLELATRTIWPVRKLYYDPPWRLTMAQRAAEVARSYQWSRRREVYRAVVDRLLHT